LAALSGICIITGVSYIAQFRITDRTQHYESIQLNMVYSISYANKAHVDFLAEKNGFRPKTASKMDGTASKMLVPGGMSQHEGGG
jgi:hypothetical protein